MQEIMSIELLDATHAFPGPFTFKAIGLEQEAFVARIVAAVRDELAAEIDPPFTLRRTAGGRHVAVTLEPVVRDARQVLAVYERLRTVTGLKMMF